MTAEEYFDKNVIWNGTFIANPIELMEAYHKEKVEAISDEINKTWIDDKGRNRSFTSEHKKRLEQLLKQ